MKKVTVKKSRMVYVGLAYNPRPRARGIYVELGVFDNRAAGDHWAAKLERAGCRCQIQLKHVKS